MRIVVTGGRDYHDHEVIWKALDELRPSAIAHGGARGLDELAGEWAELRGVPVTTYQASWNLSGAMAGLIRNIHMLDAFKPDLVAAFPGKAGTEHCVLHAVLRGIPVRRFK